MLRGNIVPPTNPPTNHCNCVCAFHAEISRKSPRIFALTTTTAGCAVTTRARIVLGAVPITAAALPVAPGRSDSGPAPGTVATLARLVAPAAVGAADVLSVPALALLQHIGIVRIGVFLAHADFARVDALWNLHNTHGTAEGFGLLLRNVGARQGGNISERHGSGHGSSLEDEEDSAGHHLEGGSGVVEL